MGHALPVSEFEPDPISALIFVTGNTSTVPRGTTPESSVIWERGATVTHSVGMRDYFRTDVRLLRAALLYVDRAEVASITQFLNSWRFHEDNGRKAVAEHEWMAPAARPWVTFGDLGFTWMLAQLAEILGDSVVSPVDNVPDEQVALAEVVLAELEPAIHAGVLEVPDLTEDILKTRRQYEVIADWHTNALSEASTLPVISVDRDFPPPRLDKGQ